MTSTCPYAVHRPYLCNNIHPRRHYCWRVYTIRLRTCTAVRRKMRTRWSTDEKNSVDPKTKIRFAERTLYLNWHYL